MADIQDAITEERKGRSNAILTYETIAKFSEKLTRVETLVEGMAEKQSDSAKGHQDHEIRIRALELVSKSTVDTSASTNKVWLFVWGAVVAIPGFIAAIANLARVLGGH